MHSDIETVLFDEERIRARVREIGARVARDTAGQDLVLLALLKGSTVFLSDLMRSIDRPLEIDFAWVSSYGDGTTSRGAVDLKVFPEHDLSGKSVLVVDDILDTGRTLAAVVETLRARLGVSEVRTCVLLDKAARRQVPMQADYAGFPVADVFVVGYGLDYAGRYRNLPYIGVLKEACYRTSPDASGHPATRAAERPRGPSKD